MGTFYCARTITWRTVAAALILAIMVANILSSTFFLTVSVEYLAVALRTLFGTSMAALEDF